MLILQLLGLALVSVVVLLHLIRMGREIKRLEGRDE